MAHHLVDLGWDVWGLSRGTGVIGRPYRTVSADLGDIGQLRSVLRGIGITHLFYTSWSRQGTEAENIAVNGAMLRNVLSAAGEQGGLEHVALLTGLKHYLGPAEAQPVPGTPDTPFLEDEPRLPVPNFYYAQEDEVLAAAARFGFTWSVHRAHTIIGYAVGNAMNMGLTLAVQAAICRENGKPFVFPGSEARWNGLNDMTDAGLLARHMTWAATTPAAAQDAYNVVNGDVFRWRSMWGRIADMLGVEDGGTDGASPLRTQMNTMAAETWSRIARKHKLKEHDVSKVASWWHTDGDLGRQREVLADMRKSRLAGFTGYACTEHAFRDLFERYRAASVIPR